MRTLSCTSHVAHRRRRLCIHLAILSQQLLRSSRVNNIPCRAASVLHAWPDRSRYMSEPLVDKKKHVENMGVLPLTTAALLLAVGTSAATWQCEHVRSMGLQCSDLSVTTTDGFILEVQRVRNSSSTGKRPAVLMWHGLIASSMTFMTNLRNQSLGAIAADEGYDVYLVGALWLLRVSCWRVGPEVHTHPAMDFLTHPLRSFTSCCVYVCGMGIQPALTTATHIASHTATHLAIT
jgi:hypothetical protein